MVSRYLLSRRRGLKEACLEIGTARGRSAPCNRCGLGELCERSLGEPTEQIRHPPSAMLAAAPVSALDRKKVA